MAELRRERVPLLVGVIFVLLVAMWAGLVRMGWNWPTGPNWAAVHGALMVSGFLGALIGLERAVAIDRLWGYSGPVLTALSAFGLILGLPLLVGQVGLWIGSGLIVVLFIHLLRRQAILPVWVMAAGTLMWFVGNGLWTFGFSVPHVVLWWVGYLALTIVGERIELARVLALGKSITRMLDGTLALYVLGALLAFASYDLGVRVAGLGLLTMALWLLRYDIARRTVKLGGLPAFAAVCLLAGYVWMGIAGIMALWWGGVGAGFHYDAWLHAFFLGFVFSMIFGHAPIIFPTVLGLPIEYRRRFYVHLVLLHGSLLIRVGADLLANAAWRRWGGLLNAVALLLFLGSTAAAVMQARRRAGRRER